MAPAANSPKEGSVYQPATCRTCGCSQTTAATLAASAGTLIIKGPNRRGRRGGGREFTTLKVNPPSAISSSSFIISRKFIFGLRGKQAKHFAARLQDAGFHAS